MSQRVFLGGGPEVSLVFRACLGGALLERGLGPPRLGLSQGGAPPPPKLLISL